MCKTSGDKSKPFVKDARRVAAYENKRKCLYPRNYDEIVKHGVIKEIGMDDDAEVKLALIYGKENKDGMRPSFTLVLLGKYVNDIRNFYTLYGLCGKFPVEDLDKSYFEPFGFTRLELRKYMPVLEIQKTEDPNKPYELINTCYLAKRECSLNDMGQIDENDRDEKGRNGKILYISTYDRRDTTFYVIRNENHKLELDKSLISVPFVLTASFFKLCGKILTFLPMKLGEYLLRQQSRIAKVFGNVFFTPFMPIKFVVNLGAIFGKVPVLLFVAKKEKYGDYYFTLWKHEVEECVNELQSDISLIKNGKRPEKNEYDKYECKVGGTWEELNIIKKRFKMYTKLDSV